jgi:hypothetical protein
LLWNGAVILDTWNNAKEVHYSVECSYLKKYLYGNRGNLKLQLKKT